MRKQIAWQILVWSCAALAAWGAQRGVRYVWSKASDSKNPSNPFDESTSWQEAAAMAAVLAVAASVARKLSRRGAEKIWEVTLSEPPPGVV